MKKFLDKITFWADSNLSAKDLRALRYGSICLVLFIVFYSITTINSAVKEMKDQVSIQKVVKDEVQFLAKQIKGMSSTPNLEAGGETTAEIDTLLAWLEKQVTESGLTTNLKQISPVSGKTPDIFKERAKINLDNISMPNLLKFLKSLEATVGIELVEADIQRQKGKKIGISFRAEIGLL